MEKHEWNSVYTSQRAQTQPNARWGQCCCVVKDEIVVFGGYAGKFYLLIQIRTIWMTFGALIRSLWNGHKSSRREIFPHNALMPQCIMRKLLKKSLFLEVVVKRSNDSITFTPSIGKPSNGQKSNFKVKNCLIYRRSTYPIGTNISYFRVTVSIPVCFWRWGNCRHGRLMDFQLWDEQVGWSSNE